MGGTETIVGTAGLRASAMGAGSFCKPPGDLLRGRSWQPGRPAAIMQPLRPGTTLQIAGAFAGAALPLADRIPRETLRFRFELTGRCRPAEPEPDVCVFGKQAQHVHPTGLAQHTCAAFPRSSDSTPNSALLSFREFRPGYQLPASSSCSASSAYQSPPARWSNTRCGMPG